MIDIKLIRSQKDLIEKRLQSKVPGTCLDEIVELDVRNREALTEVEALKNRKNLIAKEIGNKKRQGLEAEAEKIESNELSAKIDALEAEAALIEPRLQDLLARLPNLPFEDIPVADHPQDNVCLYEYKTKPTFLFPFKNHVELNENLHLFDFKRGAKISGSGWPVYKGIGARLEWALINFMIETHLNNGFEQWMVPLLVREQMMFGAGTLPKFAGQFYKLEDKEFPLYLVPTAEVALNALHMDEILEESELPKKYIAYTPCFRREAGAAGSNERGLIRTHQFNKVEMFAFTKPEESEAMFHTMMASAESILKGLDLHYRNMLLVTGDMSFAASKTIDIEVWLPGQNRYYEVSSVSNCTDFQARRSGIRFKRQEGGKPEFLHTLNGSGLATSRLLVAILENNQQADGSVLIPKVLQKYLNGLEVIKPC